MQTDLFPAGIHALNVGVAEFAGPPREHGATVVELDWRPPAGGDRDLGLLLARLEDDPDDFIGAMVQRAVATLNEGLGKVLRFGAYGQEVLDRLRWMAGTLGPALGNALRAGGPLDLKNITAQALQMGDECHNRNVAATSLFARLIAPALVRSVASDAAAAVHDFLEGNNHFYLNLSMAACKASLDAVHDLDGSTVVNAMARNGVEFG